MEDRSDLIEGAILVSKARIQKLIADENATPLSRFPQTLLDLIDLCVVAAFADGVQCAQAIGSVAWRDAR